MTRVRAVWTELVERKLWPVAAALVVALIAVPMLLASGGDKAGTPGPASLPSGVATAHPAAVVSLQSTTSSKLRNRKGSVRDPFVQQHVPPAASSSPTGSPSSGAGPGTSAPVSVNNGAASPLDSNYGVNPVTGSSGTPTTSVRSLPSGSSVYHVVLRIKQLGKVTWLHDVARYDRLPSDDQRYVLFLGVLSDRKTAMFSMMVDGYLFGNARCRPSRKFCSTFEMRVGDSELLTLPQADGSVKRVRITVWRIFAKHVKKAGTAAKSSSSRHSGPVRAAFIK